jgi:cytochrome c peroxidase
MKEMCGPDIRCQGGRTDYVDDSKLPPRGRLPDGAKGADHIRFIFNRMGFNDREIVALSGAHNLGRCHSYKSGLEDKWVNKQPYEIQQHLFPAADDAWMEEEEAGEWGGAVRVC